MTENAKGDESHGGKGHTHTHTQRERERESIEPCFLARQTASAAALDMT